MIYTRFFLGLRTDEKRHLPGEGELTDARNVVTGRGGLDTRKGITVAERFDASNLLRWPMLLWTDTRVEMDGGQNRNLNAIPDEEMLIAMEADPR